MRKFIFAFAFLFGSVFAESPVFLGGVSSGGETGEPNPPPVVIEEVGQPNPPVWPASVKVFYPGHDDEVKGVVEQIFQENGGTSPEEFHGQWSNSRYALLFTPGQYNVHVNVGYYTSVIGLGKEPADTIIKEVRCENGSTAVKHGALSNFWRSAENFSTNPDGGMMWAVSQACPLRRVVVEGNLNLFQVNYPNPDAGYSSGGFMADCVVKGTVASASQQQWFSRNTEMTWAQQGVWNMVFLGCVGAPPSHCGLKFPFTTVDTTPVIAEKPYIVLGDDGKYSLAIPNVEQGKVGATKNYDDVRLVDFSQVYVATDQSDVGVINDMLAQGLDVVLTPGQYHLTDSITVNREGACVLGIGFPTLIAENGKPCIAVGDVDDVRIAGVLLQAGPVATETLLKWGNGDHVCVKPGFLYDCFARVGGTNDPNVQQMQAKSMVQINSGNVVCDDLWLWRADHGVSGLIYNSQNPCETGIDVNGDDVIAYGLAVEHTLKDMTAWKGNNGQVYFYQSEYPYDVTQENYGDPGYVSYRVDPSVTNHEAWGVGVYSFFRDHDVTVQMGISAPTGEGIRFVNPLTVFLDGKGRINHILNDRGSSVPGSGGDQAYLCDQLGESSSCCDCLCDWFK